MLQKLRILTINTLLFEMSENQECFSAILDKINTVKNCIKKNTMNPSIASIFDKPIQFQTKENFRIQIRLYK